MSAWTIIGILLVLLLIIGIGAYSGRKIKDSGDFITGGGKVNAWIVCGAIMGALVSSQATIGTAQLAFHFGLSAWWFTLGSGFGCLVLGLCYGLPLRRSGAVTEMQIISGEYGALSGSLSSILCCIGIFLSVLAQMIACIGLATALIPGMSVPAAALLSMGLMCFYVVFGGTWGAGMGGVLKLILLYGASLVGMIYTLKVFGGPSGISKALHMVFQNTDLGAIQQEIGLSALSGGEAIKSRFFSLVSRGPMKDIGSGLSLLFGVICTQTYAQAILSAKSDYEAKKGALLATFLIPPIGVAGILIGLFMRTNYLLQSEVQALVAKGLPVPQLPVLEGTIQVFPTFVLNHLHPLLAGIILGTLFISVVGGGAGLSLGMATIIVKDIYKRFFKKMSEARYELASTRLTIVAILGIAALVASSVKGTIINDFGFLSMGLRGAVVFVPLSGALWLKGRIKPKFILASIVVAPLAVIGAKLMKAKIDPLFVGIVVSLLFALVGLQKNKPAFSEKGGSMKN